MIESRFVAYTNNVRRDVKRFLHNKEYNTVRNLNAYTGEYYEKDKFAFLVLEENSAKQFGDGTVFLGLEDVPVSVYDKWDGAQNFRRIAGGIG